MSSTISYTLRPPLGKMITLDLNDGTVLVLTIAGVANMSVRDVNADRNTVTLYDARGGATMRASFKSWQELYRPRAR